MIAFEHTGKYIDSDKYRNGYIEKVNFISEDFDIPGVLDYLSGREREYARESGEEFTIDRLSESEVPEDVKKYAHEEYINEVHPAEDNPMRGLLDFDFRVYWNMVKRDKFDVYIVATTKDESWCKFIPIAMNECDYNGAMVVLAHERYCFDRVIHDDDEQEDDE